MNLQDPGFETVMEQVRLVWDMLPLAKGEYRYLFLKTGEGHRGTWVQSEAALTRVVGLATPSTNIYIQLNPVGNNKAGRPSSKDVTRLQGILIDIDPLEITGQLDLVLDAASQHLQNWLSGMEVSRQQIAEIASGRGRQLWILLHGGTLFNPVENIARVRTLVAQAGEQLLALQLPVRVDPSCVDAVRLARMPGSVNLKTSRKAEVLRPGQPGSSAFLEHFNPMPVPEINNIVPKISSNRWWHYVPYLTTKAQDFIFFGVKTPGRHAAAFATAMSLAESLVPDSTAVNLIEAGCAKCSPPLLPTVGFRAWYQARTRISGRQIESNVYTVEPRDVTEGPFFNAEG